MADATPNKEQFSVEQVVEALKLSEHTLAGVAGTIPLSRLGQTLLIGLGARLPSLAGRYRKDPTKHEMAVATAIEQVLELLDDVQNLPKTGPDPRRDWLGRELATPPKEFWSEGDITRRVLELTIEYLREILDAVADGRIDKPAAEEKEDAKEKGILLTLVLTPEGPEISIRVRSEESLGLAATLAERLGLKPDSIRGAASVSTAQSPAPETNASPS